MFSAIRLRRAKQLKMEVPGWNTVVIRTIQDICNKRLELLAQCAAKKPLLNDKMVTKRLAFSKKFRSWMEKDWETLMFSDNQPLPLSIQGPRRSKVPPSPAAKSRSSQTSMSNIL
jgi:hypothetical protein